MKRLGLSMVVYGGTFDPIHNGHIKVALNIQQQFHFDKFLFLPCKVPALKATPIATTPQRVKMLELALADLDKSQHFELDLSEVNRSSPSFMVDSLRYFRHLWGQEVAISLLIGMDCFISLPKWHATEEILSLAHILVIERDGIKLPKPAQTLAEVYDYRDLSKVTHGLIYHYDAGSYNISSSLIRRNIQKGSAAIKNLLPEAVFNYIKHERLYT